jgi:glycosyltransferase involved in cell wall biosynthesis
MHIKLLQVMLAPGDGGAETFFEKLAIAFQEAGIEQRLVICRHTARRKRLESAGCEVIEIPAQGWQKWLAGWRLRRIADDFMPTHQLAWMSRAAMALEHRAACVNMARLGGYYPKKYYTNCDWLLANTPSVIEHLKRIDWPEGRMRLISNFGELPDASVPSEALRSELGLSERDRVILTLGRLHVNKAQDTLIKALPSIPDTVLLIAGEGELRDELLHLARESGVEARVQFLGWRRDTPALFQLADICVFPSRQEPLGNVVLEAWAHGVPIAAAASEGPSWLIEDEVNGLLFPIDDVDACARASCRLLQDQALAARCVAGGRIKWRAEYSKEAIVGQYLQFFNEVFNS